MMVLAMWIWLIARGWALAVTLPVAGPPWPVEVCRMSGMATPAHLAIYIWMTTALWALALTLPVAGPLRAAMMALRLTWK